MAQALFTGAPPRPPPPAVRSRPAELPAAMANAEKMQELVDDLCAMDADSIITVITSVLQARPETAPAVAAFAVPELTYTPHRALKDKRCQGIIKSFSEHKGFGFIECDDLKAAFGNDVF